MRSYCNSGITTDNEQATEMLSTYPVSRGYTYIYDETFTDHNYENGNSVKDNLSNLKERKKFSEIK